MKEIETLINTRINELSTEIANIAKQSQTPQKTALDIINDTINKKTITTESFNYLINNFDLFSNEEIRDINLFVQLQAFSTITLNEELLSKVIGYFEKAKIIIQKSIDSISQNGDLVKEVNALKTITNKLKQLGKEEQNGVYLSVDDIKVICDLIKTNGSNLTNASAYITALTIASVKAIQNSNIQEEEIEEIEETNLNEEDVINVFKEFHYDFATLPEKTRTPILKYGNLENIKNIFAILKEFGIKLDISKKLYRETLANLLVYSYADIIEYTFNRIKEDYDKVIDNGEKIDPIIDIYIETLTLTDLFVKGNKSLRTKKKETRVVPPPGPRPPSDGDKVIRGRSEEFKIICEILNDNNMNVARTLEKSKTVFNNSSERVRQNFEDLKLYKISPENYRYSLSGPLAGTNIASRIDAHIEGGLFDYLNDNMSSLTKLHNDKFFYRIKRYHQLNNSPYDNSSIYISGTKKQISGIKGVFNSNKLSPENFFIDEENGPKVVGQYFPKNPKFVEYDAALSDVMFGNHFPLAQENYFIKKLEENFKEDYYTYNINGIIISRIKVFRIYEELIKKKLAGTTDSVLYALSKYSILTQEEYHILDETIYKLYSKGVDFKW